MYNSQRKAHEAHVDEPHKRRRRVGHDALDYNTLQTAMAGIGRKAAAADRCSSICMVMCRRLGRCSRAAWAAAGTPLGRSSPQDY